MPTAVNDNEDPKETTEMRLVALAQKLNIIYMALALMAALPLNVCVLVRIVDKLKRNTGNRRNLLLKLHLNLSDLLICCLFVVPRIIWAITHQFYGGWLLCKFIMFGIVFSFVLSSSILAVIGIDRLWGIIYPFNAQHVAVHRVKVLITISWLYSMAFSLPQIVTWDEISFHNETHCASIFTIAKVDHNAAGILATVDNTTINALSNIYSWIHMSTSIYLPFSLILICYAVMMQQVCCHLVCNRMDPADATGRRASNDSDSSCKTTRSTHISRDATTAATIRSNRSLMRQITAGGSTAVSSPAVNVLQRKNTTSSIQSQQQQQRGGGERILQRMNTTTSIVVTSLRSIKYRNTRGGVAQSMRTSIKMLKTAFILITAYILCWAPYAIFNVLSTSNTEFAGSQYHWIFDICTKNWLILNSVINPLLYGFQRKDLRQLTRKVRKWVKTCGRCLCCFCCICCKLFTYEWDESSDADDD